jgi:hypothetical protein
MRSINRFTVMFSWTVVARDASRCLLCKDRARSENVANAAFYRKTRAIRNVALQNGNVLMSQKGNGLPVPDGGSGDPPYFWPIFR